jgi:hypothetical protein
MFRLRYFFGPLSINVISDARLTEPVVPKRRFAENTDKTKTFLLERQPNEFNFPTMCMGLSPSQLFLPLLLP